MLSTAEVLAFSTFGFIVLRDAFDPGPLAEEVDRSLREGASAWSAAGAGGTEFRYVPLMCERTPLSLSLLDRFAPLAAQLLRRPVLPVRAKGVSYLGATDWHSDSGRDVASVGFVAYLESLGAASGALRVLPGSHRAEFGRAIGEYIQHRAAAAGTDVEAAVATLPGYSVDTEPGDVIVFDEHLYHASAGGRDRRQWRVDYVEDPADAELEAKVRAYFAGIYPPDWDGGYDVDRFPSYGEHWRGSALPGTARLEQLGVYAAAAAQEGFARRRHADTLASLDDERSGV